MNIRKIVWRGLIGLAVAAAACVCIIALLYLWVLTPRRTPMGKYDFESAGVTITLWTESDWDCGPVVYYNVRERRKIVVPMTYLAIHRDNTPFPVHTYSTSDGELLALTHDLPYGQSRLVIFDKITKESWPRLRDDEVSSAPEVKRKWRDRYARLKKENSDLVPEEYFVKDESK